MINSNIILVILTAYLLVYIVTKYQERKALKVLLLEIESVSLALYTHKQDFEKLLKYIVECDKDDKDDKDD